MLILDYKVNEAEYIENIADARWQHTSRTITSISMRTGLLNTSIRPQARPQSLQHSALSRRLRGRNANGLHNESSASLDIAITAIAQVCSRDLEFRLTNGITIGTVDQGLSRVNVSKRLRLERVTESNSSLIESVSFTIAGLGNL